MMAIIAMLLAWNPNTPDAGVLRQPQGGTGTGSLGCSSGQFLTSDGGSFYCATPASLDGGASTGSSFVVFETQGALTNSRVLTSGTNTTVDNSISGQTRVNLSGSLNYSGLGSCSSSQWVFRTNANAAPTCTQPAFTDLSGSLSITSISATGAPGPDTFLRGDGTWAVVQAPGPALRFVGMPVSAPTTLAVSAPPLSMLPKCNALRRSTCRP